jgi:hypothetical protein
MGLKNLYSTRAISFPTSRELIRNNTATMFVSLAVTVLLPDPGSAVG